MSTPAIPSQTWLDDSSPEEQGGTVRQSSDIVALVNLLTHPPLTLQAAGNETQSDAKPPLPDLLDLRRSGFGSPKPDRRYFPKDILSVPSSAVGKVRRRGILKRIGKASRTA